MAEIIKHAYVEEIRSWEHHWHYVDDPGSGFFCPCSSDGTIDWDALNPAARKNIQDCLDRAIPGLVYDGVVPYVISVQHDTVILCACGKPLELSDGFLNTCSCGRDYNGAGQLLAPRHQWGEETGETLADIFNGKED